METSDSEYFESADEDFQSDDEDTKTVRSVTKDDESSEKCIKSATTQLKNVELAETQLKKTATGVNNNKNSDSHNIDNVVKDDENNVSTGKTEVRKEPVNELEATLSKKNDDVQKRDDSELVEDAKPDIKTKTGVDNTDNILTKTDNTKEENLWDEIEDWGFEKDEESDSVQKVQNVETFVSTSTDDVPVKTDSSKETNLWEESEGWGQEKDEENMWDNDEWEAVEPQQPPRPHPDEKVPPTNTTWGSWSNWGVSSILSTATQSVSTITQGISTVLETGMGVPEPEELARINQTEKQKLKELSPDSEGDKSTGFGLGNLVMGVSHLTKLVETTSTKVISGGLDTLETIGKKTMEVLQEGDPGLKKKRAFLTIDHDKPVLSQLLREAKEKAEEENKVLEEKHFAKKAKNYETLFDDHQGLVHLEALEMLSKQCDIKLQTLLESYSGDSLTDMQETMDQVKELCELPDEDEDEQTSWSEILDKLNVAVSEIDIPISYKKLIETWEETETWLNNLKLEVCDERELHQQAVETLAQLTALAVEQFHKAAELLLVKEHRSTADEADSLVQLTTSLTSLIGIVAAKFSDKLNTKNSNSKNKEAVNGLITNVFFEAANSSSYIQDAFQLLVPVLQVGAV